MNTLSILMARHRQNEKASGISEKPLRYMELTLVLRGRLEYRNGERKLPLGGGDVLFLPVGARRARNEGEEKVDYVSFNFTGDGIGTLPEVIRGGVTREILFLLSAFDEIQKEAFLPNAKKRMEHLLISILFSLQDQIRARETNPLVQKITAFLHQNLSEKISLESIAEHTYFSPVYCETVFKKETGRSIIDTLIDLRIGEAKALLVQGQYSMEEIARMAGFGESNYFSRIFKKRTGHTPSGYRRLFQPGP